MSYAARLSEALRIAGVSIRGFHDQIKDRDVPGNSYAVIHRYLRGKATPPVAFLQAASEILGVRPEWLVLDKGEPTEIEQQMRGSEPDPVDTATRDRVDARFADRFPALDYLDNEIRMMVLRVMVRSFRDVTIQPGHPMMADRAPEVVSETVADWLARSLGEPVMALRPEGVRKEDLEDYVVLMCEALLRLVPSPTERMEMERAREAESGEA